MLRDWVRTKLPDKVFTEQGVEHYLHSDWDTPPQPETLVRLGLAATIEEAQTLIAKDKSLWGGSRNYVALDAIETSFGSIWPTTPPLFGAKPTVLVKLKEADSKDNLGFGAMLGEWANRGLIK